METACPILYTLGGAAAAAHAASTSKLCNHAYGKSLCSNTLIAFPRKSRPDRFGGKLKKCVHLDEFICYSSAIDISGSNPSPEFAVLLEVEGVLMDVYRLVNRQAFNVAFKKLGLDCANLAEPVYLDLVRKSAADEERMLVLYFSRIGWPTSLATNEKATFMKNVFREKKNAVNDLVLSKDFSLRPGAEEFIDEACKEGIPVIILTAYNSRGENVARSIVQKLGTERLSKIKIVGDEEVKQSFYGQLVSGKGVSTSLDEQLAREVSKAASAERQRVAEEVASMLKLKVELNTSSSESLQNVVAALRAGAEYAELPLGKCILVAGSQVGISAAERIGMPSVVLRSRRFLFLSYPPRGGSKSSTARAEFPSATAVMDGFGGADLTVSRLRKKFLS